MLTFNTDNMVAQEFPFPAPIMDYIYNNISATQLLKLYKTCKFFYAKFGLNIIEDFEICENKENERIVGNSLAIWRQNPSFLELNNLWISKSFTFVNEDPEDVLPHEKFSRLTFDKLEIDGVFASEDYEFFAKENPFLLHLIIRGAILYPESEMILSIEDIIECVPQVSTIDLTLDNESIEFPPIDMTKLLSLERQTKLAALHLSDVPKIPDPLLVIEFFKKHGVPEIDYYFEFDKNDADYNVANVKTFYKTFDDDLQAWKLSLQLPPTISSSSIDLTGKLVVITGVSHPIGKATVILFRQLGASVIAVARNQAQLKDLITVCQNIKNNGFLHTSSQSFPYGDVAVKFFARVYYKFGGKIDILVNVNDNFGYRIIPNTVYEKTFCQDYFNVLKAHYNLIRAASPYLIEAKGCIINVPTSNELNIRQEKLLSIPVVNNTIKNIEAELVFSGVRVKTVNSYSTFTPFPCSMPENDSKVQNSKMTHDEEVANAIASLAIGSDK